MAHVIVDRHNAAGNTKRLTCTLTNKTTGMLTDPTTLTAIVESPEPGVDAVTYTYGGVGGAAWVRDSLGVYTFTFTPDYGTSTPWRVQIRTVTGDVKTTTIAEIHVGRDDFA